MTTLQIVISALAGVTVLALLVDIIRDRQPDVVSAWGLIAVEVGLLVQLVWGIVRLFGEHEGVAVGAYLGYLLGSIVLLPIAFFWSATEKSRSGTAVLLVAVLVVPVLCVRLHEIWAGHV